MDVGCDINNFRIQISSSLQPASTLMFKQKNPWPLQPKGHVKRQHNQWYRVDDYWAG